MLLTIERMPSPIGPLLLACDGALRALDTHDDEAGLREMLHKKYGAREIRMGRVPAEIRGAIEAYFEGELTAIDRIPVEPIGSEFQLSVWSELRAIPVGTTTTYGALAGKIGKPGASRAVGLANGSNPIALVVPCHRVIGADGTLTGYGGGLPIKRWLLAHEGVQVPGERQLDLIS